MKLLSKIFSHTPDYPALDEGSPEAALLIERDGAALSHDHWRKR